MLSWDLLSNTFWALFTHSTSAVWMVWFIKSFLLDFFFVLPAGWSGASSCTLPSWSLRVNSPLHSEALLGWAAALMLLGDGTALQMASSLLLADSCPHVLLAQDFFAWDLLKETPGSGAVTLVALTASRLGSVLMKQLWEVDPVSELADQSRWCWLLLFCWCFDFKVSPVKSCWRPGS